MVKVIESNKKDTDFLNEYVTDISKEILGNLFHQVIKPYKATVIKLIWMSMHTLNCLE